MIERSTRLETVFKERNTRTDLLFEREPHGQELHL